MNQKEVTVITGASRGIGRALALKFAALGHDLALFGRDEEKLKETLNLVELKSSQASVFIGDVADHNFVSQSFDSILGDYGRIDHLINNAGIAVFKKFVDTSLQDFQKQIDANLYGVFNFTKAVVPHFISRKGGSIINISSIAGKNGFVYGTTYAASKHAVMGFTRSLMMELREFNIRVAAVCPGSVDTEMIEGSPVSPTNLDKVLTPEDVAETVAAIIKLPERALINEIEIRPTNPK